ncbi:MAG: formylmethanofuran dehydrogenase subunit C [Methanothrix sp.]|nr:formylmethanofuran dehydrogenase subunit C [Methanothrix sp.]
MRTVSITPKGQIEISVEAECISPESVAPLGLEEIGALEIWQGNRRTALSDLFLVEGDEEPCRPDELHLLLKGDFSRVKRIAEKMAAGTVEVQGSTGMHAGNRMSGGVLTIHGDADDWLGREMRGGRIHVYGSAGNYAGAGYRGERCGMRGGEIEIEGSAGAFLGEHICGGTIRVKGDAGDFPGVANQGGTIFIGGSTYLPGAEMTKGSITVRGSARLLPGYQRIEVVKIEGEEFQRYTGDLVERGSGELFILVGSS